jgi:hypothetical protein
MRSFQHRLSRAIILLLAGVVFICAAAIVPPLWEAAEQIAKSEPDYSPHHCMQIPHGPRRLDCFERVMERPPPQPARGASAPVELFNRRRAD